MYAISMCGREERVVASGTDSAEYRLVSRVRPLVEPALVVLTVGALAAGGLAWLAGWRAVADGCWIAGTWSRVVPAVVWVLVGAAARTGRRGSDRGAVAGRHAAGRRVPGRRVDRGDAGRWTCAGGGRRAPSLARPAGAARTRAAIRPTPGRHRGERDPAGRGGGRRPLGRRPRRSGARGRAHRRRGGRAGRIGADR